MFLTYRFAYFPVFYIYKIADLHAKFEGLSGSVPVEVQIKSRVGMGGESDG